jgi:hypothetical protein
VEFILEGDQLLPGGQEFDEFEKFCTEILFGHFGELQDLFEPDLMLQEYLNNITQQLLICRIFQANDIIKLCNQIP